MIFIERKILFLICHPIFRYIRSMASLLWALVSSVIKEMSPKGSAFMTHFVSYSINAQKTQQMLRPLYLKYKKVIF